MDEFKKGAFVVGCNYWASHSGTAMWSDWRPDVVEADLKQLAAEGMQVLRVFPLWPEFQPLRLLRGAVTELRVGEDPLPDDEFGRAGVSRTAMERFAVLADLAAKYDLKLVVGLLTGWMSGRHFAPQAFDGHNHITDPLSIQWQVRFVRAFVRHFRSNRAIVAWDLGNECNCMGHAPSQAAAWTWTHAISAAIRIEDGSRPVISGMHSLKPDSRAVWRIQDQAELTDILTTHPYPYFTPHCALDPINTIRSCLHATAESRLYADIGGKPCMAEELGTLGPMFASDDVAADYVRTALFSLWAHDCMGLLWWCAYDQTELTHAPYDWTSLERELGLVTAQRRPKPVIRELKRFRGLVDSMPFAELPERVTDAVCILTEGQDCWAAAFGAFVLAKQAGLDISFQFAGQPLRPARAYIVPSVSGTKHIENHSWAGILDAVRKGAALYMSLNEPIIVPLNEPFGVQIVTREHRTGPARFKMKGLPAECTVGSPCKLTLRTPRAEVLAREPDGNPVLTRASLGKGEAYLLGVPLELHAAHTPGAFDATRNPPYWQIYRRLAAGMPTRRVARRDNPMVGLTEHPFGDGSRAVIAINYSPAPAKVKLALDAGYRFDRTLHGPAPRGGRCTIPANDAAVWKIEPVR
jgi:hypothetical protein